jgi:hypothetical protein
MTDKRLDAAPGGHIDPDDLAAYLDGTLAADERAAVERALADSQEAREVLAEAARMLGYEDRTEEPGTRLAGGGRPRAGPGARRWFLPVLAAAGVGAIALLPFLRPTTAGDGLGDVDRLLHEVSGALPTGREAPPWSVLRSTGAELERGEAAFRAGALWTDALVAWRSDRNEAARNRLAELAELLGAVPLAGPAAQAVSRLAAGLGTAPGGDEEAVARVDEAQSALMGALPPARVKLGMWAQGALLAADAGATSYLRQPATRSALAGIASEDLPAEVVPVLDELEALLGGELDGPALASLVASLERLFTILGG